MHQISKQAVQFPLLALQFLFVVVAPALVLAKAVVPVLELDLCGLNGICKVDGTSKLSLVVTIVGEKGKMTIDMVNCPNLITTSKHGILTSIKWTKPKLGGFEYELYAAKKAIAEGKYECAEWTHQNSIAMAKIIEDIFNSKEAQNQ